MSARTLLGVHSNGRVSDLLQVFAHSYFSGVSHQEHSFALLRCRTVTDEVTGKFLQQMPLMPRKHLSRLMS